MKRVEKMFLFILTLVAAQAITLSHANAEVGEGTLQTRLEKLDADKDGYISLKEAVKDTVLLRHFSRMDDNQDGKLSRQELDNDLYHEQLASQTASSK